MKTLYAQIMAVGVFLNVVSVGAADLQHEPQSKNENTKYIVTNIKDGASIELTHNRKAFPLEFSSQEVADYINTNMHLGKEYRCHKDNVHMLQAKYELKRLLPPNNTTVKNIVSLHDNGHSIKDIVFEVAEKDIRRTAKDNSAEIKASLDRKQIIRKMVQGGAWYCLISRKVENIVLVTDKKLSEIDSAGTVVIVEDGDTFFIKEKDKYRNEVRIRAIDAPEEYASHLQNTQPYYKEAKEELLKILKSTKSISLEIRSDNATDSSGRTLAKVTYKKINKEEKNKKEITKDIGLQLILKGAAWHIKRYKWQQEKSDRLCYAYAQQLARGYNLTETEQNEATENKCGFPEELTGAVGKKTEPKGLWGGANPEPPWNWRLTNLERYETYNINPVEPTLKEIEEYKIISGISGKKQKEEIQITGNANTNLNVRLNLDQQAQAVSAQEVPSGGSWETAVLVGLSDAITELAEDNMIDWFVTEILADLCNENSKEYFPNLCKLRKSNEIVAVQSKTILRNTIQRDIDNLPALLAAKGYKESQEYQVNYWVYILGGLLTNARKGVPATYLVSGLADDPFVRAFCRDENRHACALLLAGAMMQAYLAVPYFTSDEYPRWKTWQNEFLSKLENKIVFDLKEVFGSCGDESTDCYKIIKRLDSLKKRGELGLGPYHKLRNYVDTISFETGQLAAIEHNKENLGIIYRKAFIISENTLKAIQVVNDLFGGSLTCEESERRCSQSKFIADLHSAKFTKTMLSISGFFSGNYNQGYIELLQAIEMYEADVKKIKAEKEATNYRFGWAINSKNEALKFLNKNDPDANRARQLLATYYEKIYDMDPEENKNPELSTCAKPDNKDAVEKARFVLVNLENVNNCLEQKLKLEKFRDFCKKNVTGETDSEDMIANLCKEFNSWDKKGQENLVTLKTRIPFLVELASASTSEQAKSTIKRAASPVGSWRLKRGTQMWSVGALAGVMFGQERLSSNSVTTDFGRRAKVYGIFMPVGIDYSYSKNARQDTYGIFVSLLDLGAIATLRSGDNSDTVSVESEANFGFEQIVSPGIYFRYGIPNSPLVIGAGWSRTPRLRSITIKSTAESIDMDSTRLLLFMAVDVPLFPIN